MFFIRSLILFRHTSPPAGGVSRIGQYLFYYHYIQINSHQHWIPASAGMTRGINEMSGANTLI